MQFNHFYDLGIAYSNNNWAFRHYGYQIPWVGVDLKYFRINNNSNQLLFNYIGSNGTNISATEGKTVLHWFDSDNNITYLSCANNNFRFNANMYHWSYHSRNLIFNLQTIPNTAWDNVTNMSHTYYWSNNITGQPVCGPNVTNMSSTYSNCYNLIGYPVCGNLVTNMCYTYYNCHNLLGNPACGPNVNNMVGTYYNTNVNVNVSDFYFDEKYNHNINLLQIYSKVPSTNVFTTTDVYNDELLTKWGFAGRFANTLITGQPICSDNITNMYYAYFYCNNLTGNPVCGNNVTDMSYAYAGCEWIENNVSPVCGPNVVNMYMAYQYCPWMDSSPVCGNNVTDMYGAYSECWRITGSPVCGPNVVNMYMAYSNCRSLTGQPVCGPNVVDMGDAYTNCYRLNGNMFMQSDNVKSVISMLQNCRGVSYGTQRIDIWVRPNTLTNNTLWNNGSTSMFNRINSVDWTQNTSNNTYYFISNGNNSSKWHYGYNVVIHYNWNGQIW